MSNFFDATYDKSGDPSKVFVWEQNYETNKVELKEFDVEDYLYFYVDYIDEKQIVENITSQRGTKVQKIIANSFKELRNGSAVKMFHDMGLNTYESDIDPLQKVMLDIYGKDHQKAPKWNIGLYDIETDVQTEDSFMDMRENANREINAISVWYSKTNKFYNFTVVPPMLRDGWDYDTVEKRGKFEIVYFDNETEMLETFFAMNKQNETIAMGAWNGDFFDTKYIFDRAKMFWKEKGAAERMGRFGKVRKNKVMLGDKEEILVRPIGMIWFDCLESYKKNGPELESFALNAVAEEEKVGTKVEFEGNFETLYHGSRKDRARFTDLTPDKHRKKLIDRSNDIGHTIISDLTLYDECKVEVESNNVDEVEKETRIQIAITERLEELLKMKEVQEDLGESLVDFERFILFKKFKDTYRLFLDYSNQDSQLLHDLEKKLDKFKTLMMLAQYNVSSFYDVFSTLKQAEQGITNFAHLYNKKAVIDREYEKEKQTYNQFVDKDLLELRIDSNHKINPEDSSKIKRFKSLLGQEKIPGANVLLPSIGLISFNDAETPPLVREFKSIKAEIAELEQQLAAMK